MAAKLSINTFTINLPVKDQSIRLILYFFCSDPSRNNKTRYSYSIVGKISGITFRNASVEITSHYGKAAKLKDQLLLLHNQFAYSNQAASAGIVDVAIQLKGVLAWEEIIDACFNIKLRYTLQRLIVNDVKSAYTMRNAAQPKVLLLQ